MVLLLAPATRYAGLSSVAGSRSCGLRHPFPQVLPQLALGPGDTHVLPCPLELSFDRVRTQKEKCPLSKDTCNLINTQL